jgi:hypothetical protein
MPLEHDVVDVLQRHVDVLGELRVAAQRVHQLGIPLARVGVHDADPLDPVDLGQRLEQRRQARPARPGMSVP